MNRSMKSFHKLLSTFEVFENRNGVDVQVIVTKDNFLYIWQPLVCNYNETKKVSKICDLFFTCAMMCCFFTTEVTENCLSKTIETLSDFFFSWFFFQEMGCRLDFPNPTIRLQHPLVHESTVLFVFTLGLKYSLTRLSYPPTKFMSL